MSVVLATTIYDLEDLKYTLSSLQDDVVQNNGEIIIVIDGGSGYDKKVEELRSWVEVNEILNQTVILSKEHSGLTRSLNYGIRHARSENIFRIDSGDIWLNGRVQKQLSLLNQGYELVATTNLPTTHFTQKELLNELKFRNHIIHSSAAFKKALYNEEYYFCQDYALWITFVQKSKSIFLQNDPVCFRVNTVNGISFNKTFEQLRTAFNIRRTASLKWNINYYLYSLGVIKALFSKFRLKFFLW